MSSEPGDTDPRSHSLQALACTVGAPLLILQGAFYVAYVVFVLRTI